MGLIRLCRDIAALTKGLPQLMADLTALTEAVANETTVAQSAITLLQSLAAQISANANDPVALQALADQINADSKSLSDAVTANTPPAPTA